MATRVLAAAAAALCATAVLAAPVPIKGVQGMDDQSMSAWILAGNGGDTVLAARYASMTQYLKPGLRRYNAFWSDFEPNPPSPGGTAPTAPCAPGLVRVPLNEPDRIARGYHNYHCYANATITQFDDLLARDAGIGAASAFIVYGSPTWAQNPGCTGFPWGPTMYKSGCLPWGYTDDWEDYINYITERWNAPWGSGLPRLSGMVIWNEVGSQGWADPSPIVPNRYTGPGTWSPADMATFTGMIGNLTYLAGRAAARHIPSGMQLWLSTDHFTAAPPLNKGDVMHIGLYDVLEGVWAAVNTTYDWGVAVHPYDAGDPRANLTAQGIYTFATLKENVADWQCSKLASMTGIDPSTCWSYPQVAMWASEQGWPFNNRTMNKTIQARNICYAHGLSLAQDLWAVSHNFFQGPGPSSQGDAGDFSLIDYPPTVLPDLSNGPGHATFDAYAATAPDVYGKVASNYCCTAWGWGCPGQEDPLPTPLLRRHA